MIKAIKSIFSDKDFDADASKIIGIACTVCGIVGFFLELSEWQWLVGFGVGLLGIKAKVEGV